jgi:3-demethylubiquinone-9 3-methyltransferase.
MVQKIVPHLWFDHQAREAVDTYVQAFAPLGSRAWSHLSSCPALPRAML